MQLQELAASQTCFGYPRPTVMLRGESWAVNAKRIYRSHICRTGSDRCDGAESLQRWLIVLVGLGLGWRMLRYLVDMPIWGDEASICVNFLDRDYRQLMQPLADAQVAPLLFLWSEF